MTTEQISAQLKAYVADSFFEPGHLAALQDEDDLFKLLDSLQILRLVVQLEAVFGVRVEDTELTAENLGSIARVAAFVACKQEAKGLIAEELAASPLS